MASKIGFARVLGDEDHQCDCDCPCHDQTHTHTHTPTHNASSPIAQIALAVGFIPVSFGFALQYANLTSYVIEQLGVSEFRASLVWLCGPVTGLLIQPVVGSLLDGFTLRGRVCFLVFYFIFKN